jgi:hypothetical protein
MLVVALGQLRFKNTELDQSSLFRSIRATA